MPDFALELARGGIVAGVDEVGRGPLAGPVFAAAVILPASLPPRIAALIDDSKALSARRRAEALAALRGAGAVIALGAASVAEIERLNILHAALLAMRRAVDRLAIRPDHVLVDGIHVPALDIGCTPVPKGDATSLSIASASIVAKQARDLLMARLATRYPVYGWECNAGYAAAVHRAAILAHGPTRHHRRGFGPLLGGNAQA
jgi:ribonuclease HII